jgi:hypothetical protein
MKKMNTGKDHSNKTIAASASQTVHLKYINEVKNFNTFKRKVR